VGAVNAESREETCQIFVFRKPAAHVKSGPILSGQGAGQNVEGEGVYEGLDRAVAPKTW